MIEVRIREFKNDVFQVIFRCPHCGIALSSNFHMGDYCEFCYGDLPNVISLFDGPDSKVRYHKTGKTFYCDERIDKVLMHRRNKGNA